MSRPIALVTCGPTPVHPLGTRPGTLVSKGMARYWKFPLEPVAQARGFAAGAWRATVWPGAPAPGRYAAFLTDIKTGEYIEDLACLIAVPAPDEWSPGPGFLQLRTARHDTGLCGKPAR